MRLNIGPRLVAGIACGDREPLDARVASGFWVEATGNDVFALTRRRTAIAATFVLDRHLVTGA